MQNPRTNPIHRRDLPLLLAVALAGLAASTVFVAAAATRPGTVKDLTRAADLVFRGTVREPGAANLSLVDPNATTAIVRVDEVLKAGGTLDDFTGREVTVFSAEALGAGEVRVFFTRVRLLGESLGVEELGRAAGSPATLSAEVRSAHGEVLREELVARLAAADLVVAGRLIETRAVEPASRTLLTEHDPQWREAVLEVRTVLKGRALERTVAFLYPASIDVVWAAVPKPSAGQEGTWLLHRRPQEGGAESYVAIDPRDLLSAAEAEAAAALVQP